VVRIDDLSNEIAKSLREYTESVEEELEIAQKEVAKETVKILKQTSPELTGAYAKGWRTKKVDNAEIVHNKTDYQLTHLLEYGHVNRDGSRTQGKAHIRPAEEKAVKEFEDRVEGAIRR
jgi:hypothetical protein